METESNISTEDFPQWVVDRFAAQARVIAATAGQTKAMRYALIALIASHPNRETLQHQWQAITVELVDAEMSVPGYDSGSYRQAFQDMLASVASALAPGKDPG
jgi:hypothetical protein